MKITRKIAGLVLICSLTIMAILSISTGVLACDTMAARGRATADGSVVFAKNSDRNHNEAQVLTYYPRQTHAPGSKVKLTHMEIPQAPVTYAVIGSQPWWGFGFEQGINEFGVCMGNELVGTKDRPELVEEAPNGLDLQRIGLERGRTAYEAMHAIIDVLEEYGQAGNATNLPGELSVYWNSFLIADPNETWILETSDRRWIAMKVRGDIWSISNALTIETIYDECSEDLIEYAIEQEWYDGKSEFNFAQVFTNWLTPPSGGEIRCMRSRQLLNDNYGKITPQFVTDILRDHLQDTFAEPRFARPQDSIYRTICMHTTGITTAAGMVCHLRGESVPEPMRYAVWRCMASPCASVFTPVYFGAEVPKALSVGTWEYEEDSPWWAYDKIERMTEYNQEAFLPVVQSVWKVVEAKEFRQEIMVEAQVARLLKNGQEAEARQVLSEFVAANCDHTLEVAKALQQVLETLWKVLPGKADLKIPARSEKWDVDAKITLFR